MSEDFARVRRTSSPGSADRLSLRALGRATLARQLLLERDTDLAPFDAIEHLVGMQAQAPHAPYVGLWTRLEGFQPEQLSELITSRRAVRAPLMRATLHLVTAPDCVRLRAVVQPVLERSFAGAPFDVSGVDADELVEAGGALLAERPSTRVELGALLAQRWPDADPASLAYAVTYLVPLVQVPPRALWGQSGAARWTTVDAWLDEPVGVDPVSLQDVVLRYLAAFGPASVKDAQTWSGLTRLAEVVDLLRPRLRVFHEEQGAELFDLPDAPRPDPDTPAPPRFLPEYDNLLLSHADRARFIADAERVPLPPGPGARSGTLLADGLLAASWKITARRDRALLEITPLRALPERDAITAEGERLLRFIAPEATDQDIRFVASAA